MRRETQNILLVLLGGALVKISFTGTFLRYVKPSHKWLLVAAGTIMVVLALIAIARDLLGNRKTDSGHDEHQHSSRSAWLLLLPVLAVFVVTPPALGADAVQRAGNTSRASASEDGSALFPKLPAGDVVELPVSGFVERAAWDRHHSLNNRAIKLTGFVVHDGNDTYLARIGIGCCSADAAPVKIKLENSQAAALPNDTWLEVVATYIQGSSTKDNDYVPSATLSDLRQIPQPEDPYEIRPR